MEVKEVEEMLRVMVEDEIASRDSEVEVEEEKEEEE